MLTGTFALAQQDVDKHANCKYCGMDRKMFAHSRMLVVYDDGSELGACSLHCVAVDMAVHLDKIPKTIQVADFSTKQLIDAEKAVWVVGGDKPGVMSKRAKWAFADEAAAEATSRPTGGARRLRGGDQGRLRGHVRRHQDDPGPPQGQAHEAGGVISPVAPDSVLAGQAVRVSHGFKDVRTGIDPHENARENRLR